MKLFTDNLLIHSNVAVDTELFSSQLECDFIGGIKTSVNKQDKKGDCNQNHENATDKLHIQLGELKNIFRSVLQLCSNICM